MNPFTTLPKLLNVYFGAQRYNRNIPEIERLRREGRTEEERELVHREQNRFIEDITPKLRLTYEITGEENIPESGPIMVYSNHQSYADVLAMLRLFHDHFQIGFVAKDEWRKVKALANAILYTRSVFLVRGNPREAVRVMDEAREYISQGFSMVVFPEGTRSQRHEMSAFKPGAFKFAEKAKVPILPVTLDGGYKLFEEKGTYQPAHIKMTVHPLVHIENMSRAEQKEAAKEIEAVIRAALDQDESRGTL